MRSAGGTQVHNIKLSKLPSYCGGLAPPTAKITFKAAKITAKRTFSASGKDVAGAVLKGLVIARLTLTGTFAAAGRVSGMLTMTLQDAPPGCGGGHSRYSAKAAG